MTTMREHSELHRSNSARATVLRRYSGNRRRGLKPLQAMRECLQQANGLPFHTMWADRYLGIIIERACSGKMDNVWMTGRIHG